MDHPPASDQFRPAAIIAEPAAVAQLVEQRTFNPTVVGSSPTGGTEKTLVLSLFSALHGIEDDASEVIDHLAVSLAGEGPEAPSAASVAPREPGQPPRGLRDHVLPFAEREPHERRSRAGIVVEH
jgi:hypothetical protein